MTIVVCFWENEIIMPQGSTRHKRFDVVDVNNYQESMAICGRVTHIQHTAQSGEVSGPSNFALAFFTMFPIGPR